MRAVPYRKDFVESLKKEPSVTEEQVVDDTKASIAKMKTNIDEINRFYAERGLDSDAVVWMVYKNNFLAHHAVNFYNHTDSFTMVKVQ